MYSGRMYLNHGEHCAITSDKYNCCPFTYSVIQPSFRIENIMHMKFCVIKCIFYHANTIYTYQDVYGSYFAYIYYNIHQRVK